MVLYQLNRLDAVRAYLWPLGGPTPMAEKGNCAFHHSRQQFSTRFSVGYTAKWAIGTKGLMGTEPGEITLLLHRWQQGDKNAEEQLFQLLLPELRKIAGYCFRRERSDHTLQPTALLNEAFLRLAAIKGIDWQDRGHFLALTARVMRRLLIDYARSRPTVQFAPLEQLPEIIQRDRTPREVQIALSNALNELEAESPQMRTIVDLKNVLGLTDGEVAEALGIPVRTVQREWHDARVWLFKKMSAEGWK